MLVLSASVSCWMQAPLCWCRFAPSVVLFYTTFFRPAFLVVVASLCCVAHNTPMNKRTNELSKSKERSISPSFVEPLVLQTQPVVGFVVASLLGWLTGSNGVPSHVCSTLSRAVLHDIVLFLFRLGSFVVDSAVCPCFLSSFSAVLALLPWLLRFPKHARRPTGWLRVKTRIVVTRFIGPIGLCEFFHFPNHPHPNHRLHPFCLLACFVHSETSVFLQKCPFVLVKQDGTGPAFSWCVCVVFFFSPSTTQPNRQWPK